MPKKIPGPPSGEHKEFAVRFREACYQARHTIGETQLELARAFEVKSTTIHAWRHGMKLPSATTAQRIANGLNVSFDWLMTGRGDMRPAPATASKKTAQQIEKLDPRSRQIFEAMLDAATSAATKN
ncbi:helix-turn-helix domain-containing protein [Candidatus Contendibacter odensensis]|uniref:HTH cro/C1-type domain-containing protein n=1 Tax=Candidatus Contendobacter odensis Run_B_J11 TaxID=1400861 RepID=A0A7U7GF69_9GAMM|nr:helix-turn-helix transcriptional regulator [Candidatus Contendobacter odensis]CDH46980.1 hypothetical protein BN874_690030 [Candidatus Contendobacter odensis Run_B_J11]